MKRSGVIGKNKRSIDAAQASVLLDPGPEPGIVADLRTVLSACPDGFCRSEAMHDRPAAGQLAAYQLYLQSRRGGVDVMARAETVREHVDHFARIVDRIQVKMADSGIKLLWGTANLFSHPRYMAGAATNPDPDVFAYSATIVKHCVDITPRGVTGDVLELLLAATVCDTNWHYLLSICLLDLLN